MKKSFYLFSESLYYFWLVESVRWNSPLKTEKNRNSWSFRVNFEIQESFFSLSFHAFYCVFILLVFFVQFICHLIWTVERSRVPFLQTFRPVYCFLITYTIVYTMPIRYLKELYRFTIFLFFFFWTVGSKLHWSISSVVFFYLDKSRHLLSL